MPVLTEAYQAAFQRGFALMAQLADLLKQEDQVVITQLREAATCFMQAIELQSEQAPPYLMLASIYLGMGETSLAHKYIELAENRAPADPALHYLKDYLASPAYFQSLGHKRKAKSPVVNAAAIPKVQAILANQDKPASPAASSGLFARFFAEIVPLVRSAQDLQDWVKDCYDYELSPEDTAFVFDLMLGEVSGEAKTQMVLLQGILGAIRPEFAKQVSAFGREMARSIYGVVRQVHFLLRPLLPHYATADSLARQISTQFAESVSPEEAQAIFALLTSPAYRAPLTDLQLLKQLLDRLYPPAKESLDLTLFVQALLPKSPD